MYENSEPIKLNVGGRDFLIKQLTNYGKKRIYANVFIVIFISLTPIILSCFSGNFINDNLQIDAISDIGYYNQFFILLPFFVAFIPYYLQGLSKALNALLKRNILNIGTKELTAVIAESNSLFEKRFVTYFPYLMATLMTLYGLFAFILGGHNTWNSSSDLKSISTGEVISLIPLFLLYFYLSAIIIRIIVIFFVIKRFLTGNINIHPLHPDNCGGLSPLGDFSLRLTKAGIFVGVPCILGILSNYYQYNFPLLSINNLLIMMGYIVSLSIVFFIPLLGARKCMIDAKEKELELISNYLQNEREIIVSSIKKNNPLKDNTLFNFEGLMKLHELATSMPVFPFNSRNVIRFLTSILWPFVLLILQYIVENNVLPYLVKE